MYSISVLIKETISVCVCVQSVSSSFVLRHASLQNNVNGGVEPWSLVTKGRTLKENPEWPKGETLVTKVKDNGDRPWWIKEWKERKVGVLRPWCPKGRPLAKRKTLVTKGKTLVTNGKTLVTEWKTLVTKKEDHGDQLEDLGDQWEDLGDQGKE